MAENNFNGQRVLLLPEGSDRLMGRDAQRTNIAVAIAVANAVKTTLGPKGMDKMLVSDLGDITITNDGATILEEMNVEHPVAKIMVDVAKTQDTEVGDGTTSVIIMAGSFLKGADDLIEQGIHPTIIIRGYKMAAEKAEEILNGISEKININDTKTLEKIGMVAEGSKNIGNEDTKKHITEIAINAIKQVMTKDQDGKIYVDKDFIKVEKKAGASVANTELINGVLIDKEIAHPQMPKKVSDGKIALLDVALEIEKTETDARIEITSPDQMQSFLQQEEKMLKEMVDKIAKSGANVVFTQKGIDDVAQHYMAKAGIMAARRIKRSDMEKLAKATGAKMVTSLDDLSASDLGFAGIIEERKISGEQMIFVEKCKDPKSVSIFIRGGSQQVIDEVDRSITDLLGALTTAIEDGRYVVGGGSTETEVAEQLRAYASEIGGREQLAIQKFADALEQIPEVLAQSAGMDPIDTIVQIRSKHKSKEGKSYGVDVYKGAINNMLEAGVVEPTKMKVQEIYSASEAADMILRIDDMISSRSKGGPGGMPQGGMGEPME
ncbi:thermosome [Candidatus Mancarchaeum acidiphilum]|uniref:Thermosome n=1 Tax=Candidatus Mancarchaeum acidiphilum TaxID=1920749 RepID=A0A218NP95_9ARCH|nr:thermosome subunit beta [Candidatus Mancarchaeum acidiphilum]ASI14293.1 thermosome [Candidatus Mancarchaeum acidiphilum]